MFSIYTFGVGLLFGSFCDTTTVIILLTIGLFVDNPELPLGNYNITKPTDIFLRAYEYINIIYKK